jgi:glutathione S-transferase
VLAEKGLEYEHRLVDMANFEQFDADYLALNPNGYVPTLVHDGAVLIESSVIMNYLDDAFPEIPLKSGTPAERARINYHIKMIDEKYHTSINAVTFTTTSALRFGGWSEAKIDEKANLIPDAARRAQRKNTAKLGLDAPEAEPSIKLLDKMLREMERDMAHGPWIGGDAYSLGDAALTPYVERLASLCLLELWEGSMPLVFDWWARIQARPSYEEVFTRHTNAKADAASCAAGEAARPRFAEMLAAA